jgi:hypothetical protein
MKGQQKGVQSTKVSAPVRIKVKPGTANPPPPTIKKHYNIFVVVCKLLGTVHTDQTGIFPITSQQGYWYIMVGIYLDTNYIFCELMKNQNKGKMITAYQKMVDRMKLLALRLKHHHLDNKYLAEFKACITKNGMTYKLVPPDCHCCNITKRAIQTLKNHFVSILSGVDNRFLLSL